jgi:L-rhamnose mutarotase
VAEPRKFAEGTDVPAEKSRAELETLLKKHGATEFGIFASEERTVFMYRLRGRMVRHVVAYPPEPSPSSLRAHAHRSRIETAKRAQEAEWRRRWRALVLLVKAKLEIIASGTSSFENEFLADTLLANNQTVGEVMLPRIHEIYQTGEMPQYLLGQGDSHA